MAMNMESGRPECAFWQGKRVLITGHTGFKGGWLTIWLNKMGAEVTGVSLPPHTQPSLFCGARVETLCSSHYCDILDLVSMSRLVEQAKPDVVFHLAAQALVRTSYQKPLETFGTNVMGTAHILDALRGVDSARVAVMVTTDKVYANNEWAWPYRENDHLGGFDPYSASKAASEIIIDSYRKSYLGNKGIAVGSARAGNVIGGGDWSEDRLIPDAVRAWETGLPLSIRNPDAIRPWQHVLEPLSGYLTLAEKLWSNSELAGPYNFGPETCEAATVREVVSIAQAAYGSGATEYGATKDGFHEARWLALEIGKAKAALAYRPRWLLTEAIERTMAWYCAYRDGADALELCLNDIASFEKAK